MNTDILQIFWYLWPIVCTVEETQDVGLSWEWKISPAGIWAVINICSTLLSLNIHGGVCISALEAERASQQDNVYSSRFGSAASWKLFFRPLLMQLLTCLAGQILCNLTHDCNALWHTCYYVPFSSQACFILHCRLTL